MPFFMGGELSKREGVLLRSFHNEARNLSVSFTDLPKFTLKLPYLCWISVLNGIL